MLDGGVYPALACGIYRSEVAIASLYIKDDRTSAPVDPLARLRGTSKTEAVRSAVEAELARSRHAATPRERLDDFYRRYSLPESSGRPADKAFCDELSGDL